MRASISSSCRNDSADRDMARVCDQPGRTGSGVTVRASSTLASTDLVVGRSTAAVTVLVVATSIHAGHVDSADHSIVQADQHVQRSGVDLHHLPGRPRVRLAERPVAAVGQRAASASRTRGVLARRQFLQQSIETALRRQLHHARGMVGVQDPPRPPEKAGGRP